MKVVARCWHCNKPFSGMNHPDRLTGGYWFSEIEIEPGRKVRVHKTCAAPARDAQRRITAQPAIRNAR